jgi:transposase-like protein/DNA-directed RNA polymerase subunit RPC12/RpoP
MQVKKCTITNHRKQFGTEEQCLKHLAHQKWSSGYKCKRCSHGIYVKGRVHFDRKCQKCGHNESPKSGTLFHSMKLSLVLAFEIIYRVAVSKKGMSAIAIAREFGVNQKTADLLRKKIQSAMTSSESHPLVGEIHIDEFFVGGPEEKKQGRTKDSKKKKAVIAVEVLKDKSTVGRLYVMQIDDFSSKELGKIFDKHCTADAFIVADKWTGYNPLKEKYPNLIQKKSEKGKNFPELHLMIMNLKGWLKGIHHKVSKQRFQEYLNEFTYRFNRRSSIETINTNLINRMINTERLAKPTKLQVLQNVA